MGGFCHVKECRIGVNKMNDINEIIEKLKNSKRAAVMAHISEDPDALGSCFAMCCALRAMGNNPTCYLSDIPDDGLKFIGSDFVVYDGTNDDEHDLCVCLDSGDLKRLDTRVDIFNKCPITLNIDHHYTNDMYADYNYVQATASATGEILFNLFEKMGIEITQEIARYLYTAISGDTGGFKYSNVSPETMRIGASLIEKDINHADIARLLFDTESIAQMRLKGELMSNIHTYCDGKLNVVCIDEQLLERFGIEDGGGNLVDIPRRAEGTEVAVCIKHRKGKMKASLRSNGRVNVAVIGESFGGGGHIMASGATIDTDDIAEAERLMVAACEKAIKEQLGENS